MKKLIEFKTVNIQQAAPTLNIPKILHQEVKVSEKENRAINLNNLFPQVNKDPSYIIKEIGRAGVELAHINGVEEVELQTDPDKPSMIISHIFLVNGRAFTVKGAQLDR